MSKQWPTMKIGEVVRQERDQVGSFDGDGLPVLGVTNTEGVTNTGVEASDDKTKYFRLRPGRFVYNPYRINVGSIGLSSPTQDGICSPAYVVFVPTERIEASFLRYFLKSARGNQLINFHGNRGSVRSALRFDDLARMEIPLPPLAEQRRVVARIEELAAQIHEARTLRHQAAEEAEALPLAELSEVFNRKAKERGTIRLENLITEAGYGSSEKCDVERADGATPVLRIPNVASERINLADLKYVRLNQRDSERLLLSEGDVLVVRTNGSLELVGRSAVVPKLDEPFAFASYMIRLRFDRKRIASDYAQRMMQHLRVAGVLVDFARTTAGQYNVSLGRLRAAEIPVPPLAEQRRIVAELDALQAEVDALKRLQAETAAELDALLPAILDRAFKGEL